MVGDQVGVQQSIVDSYSDRLSELTVNFVRLNGLPGDPCGLGVKRSTVVGETPGWNSYSCLWEVFSSRKCPHLIMSNHESAFCLILPVWRSFELAISYIRISCCLIFTSIQYLIL